MPCSASRIWGFSLALGLNFCPFKPDFALGHSAPNIPLDFRFLFARLLGA